MDPADLSIAEAGTRLRSGDLTAVDWAKMNEELTKAEKKLDPEKLQDLTPATQALRRACDVLE